MKKELEDCKAKLYVAVQANKKLVKARDQASAALVEAHHEIGRLRQHVSAEAELKVEAAALKKKLAAMTSRETKNATRDEEHRKATLAKLMELQEENTLLRDSLFDLVQKGSPRNPSRATSPHLQGSSRPSSPSPRTRSPQQAARSPSPPQRRESSIRNRLQEPRAVVAAPLPPPPSSYSPLRRGSPDRSSPTGNIMTFSSAARVFKAAAQAPRSPIASPTPNLLPPPVASANTALAKRLSSGGGSSSPRGAKPDSFW